MGTKDDDRAARLKAALRDNLRRRKAQARGRADEGVEDAEDATVSAPGRKAGAPGKPARDG